MAGGSWVSCLGWGCGRVGNVLVGIHNTSYEATVKMLYVRLRWNYFGFKFEVGWEHFSSGLIQDVLVKN